MHDWPIFRFDSVPRKLEKGAILFQQGSNVEKVYFLVAGRIKLLRHSREGDSIILHVGTAGEMIAEASLFAETYHCTALVDQAAEIHALDRNLALTQILGKADNSEKLLALLSGQIRDLRQLIEIRNIRSAQSRILAYFSSTAGPDGRIELHTSLRDIAYKLGLAHETLYRELRILEKNGRLCRPEPGVIILQQ